MQTPILLHKNYTLNEEGYQLKLPLNLETIIPVDDSVRLLSQFVEAMDLTDLYSTYERINTVSPRTLLKIVLYSYMNGDYSSRSMELNCKRDINFMYLLEGKPVPDHATFARFRSIHFAPCAKRILAEMSGLLYELGEISGETIFIDGTKIEACANGQLKPAFNLHHGVDSEYITWLTISPQPTDTTTLIPFFKEAETYLSFKYKKIIADAGYKSEENYVYLEKNGQVAFIKPSNYEKSKTRKYKKDIGRIENMNYDEVKDCYTCKNGKQLLSTYVRRSKSKTGYISEKTIYQCSECKDCPYKRDCIKGNNCKTPMEERHKVLSVAKTFLKYRKEDLERILSDEGIHLRTNRSIQVEGSFGELKQDMQFRRYLSRGTSNVLAESILLAMAKNVNKLHNKIQKGKTGKHLFPLKTA